MEARALHDDGPSTKERILDVAEGIFAEKGFAGARTQEIADAANVDKKLLFYYFDSKTGLYRAVIERFLEGIGRLTLDEQYGSPDAAESLFLISAGLNAYVAENRNAVRIIVREAIDGGGQIEEMFGGAIPEIFETGAQNLRRFQDNGTLGDFEPHHFMLTFGGMSLLYYLVADFFGKVWGTDPLAPEEVRRRADEVGRLLLHGIKGKPASE